MPGVKLPANRRVGVNRTPTHTTCTDEHNVSAHHTAQSDHFSSREHAWLKGLTAQDCEPWCASRVMSRSLQHRTLTSTRSLTPSGLDARSVFTLRRFTAEWRNHEILISHIATVAEAIPILLVRRESQRKDIHASVLKRAPPHAGKGPTTETISISRVKKVSVKERKGSRSAPLFLSLFEGISLWLCRMSWFLEFSPLVRVRSECCVVEKRL